jgi:hypothetical protein
MALRDLKQKLDSQSELQNQRLQSKKWSIPSTTSFGLGRVIALDPSLRATGAVALTSTGSQLIAGFAHVFTTPADLSEVGHESNMVRAQMIAEQFRIWLQYRSDVFLAEEPWTVVVEAPPVAVGTIRRPESSLLACLALRLVATENKLPIAPMISAQEHHWLCGGVRNDKVKAHAELKFWAPHVIAGFHDITNEALRDALGVGLAHLKRVRDDTVSAAQPHR